MKNWKKKIQIEKNHFLNYKLYFKNSFLRQDILLYHTWNIIYNLFIEKDARVTLISMRFQASHCLHRVHTKIMVLWVFLFVLQSILCIHVLHLTQFQVKRCKNSVVMVSSEMLVNFSTTTFIQRCTKLNLRTLLLNQQSSKILYLQFSVVGSIGNFSWRVVQHIWHQI